MNIFTWRRLVLAALILADKVFEDYAVWNADFLTLFPESDINDLNNLEMAFLNYLNFETQFLASDFARYFFALKELSEHKESLPAKPLSQEQADRIASSSQRRRLSRSASAAPGELAAHANNAHPPKN